MNANPCGAPRRHLSSAPFRSILAAAVAAACGAGHAGTPVELPALIVSASRTDTPARQVGSAVSVVDGEALESAQVRHAADALRAVPGVAVNRGGQVGGVTDLRIRGGEADHTLVFIDGIEVTDPAAGSRFDFAHLQAADLERIEVLRGPQSALWGSDAAAGVVNVVTPRGEGPPRADVSAEYGSFGTWQLRAGAGAGDERFHARFGVSHLATDGESVSPAGREDDGYENTTFTLKTGITPVEGFSLEGVLRYVDATAENDEQDFSFPPGPTFGRVVDADQASETEQLFARVEGRLRLLDGRWEHRLSTALADFDRSDFAGGERVSRGEGRRLDSEYQTTAFLETGPAFHSLTLAAEREQEDFVRRGATADAPENLSEEVTHHGYVAEYRVDLYERLFLSAAARHDDNERFQDATTYRLSAAYLHDPTATRLHGSYGTGVKNPSFTELFGFFADFFAGNPDLQPERSRGWDLGVEQTLAGGRVVLDLTYFQAELEDEIVTTFDAGTFLTSVENGEGESDRSGVELEARARLARGLGARAGYAYVDSEDPDGETEVRRPRHTASLAVDYRFAGERAFLGLGVDYNGEQGDFDFGAVPARRVTLDDYTLVAVRGAYRITRGVELFGRVENLLDEDYQEVFGFASRGIGAFAGLRVTLD